MTTFSPKAYGLPVRTLRTQSSQVTDSEFVPYGLAETMYFNDFS